MSSFGRHCDRTKSPTWACRAPRPPNRSPSRTSTSLASTAESTSTSARAAGASSRVSPTLITTPVRLPCPFTDSWAPSRSRTSHSQAGAGVPSATACATCPVSGTRTSGLRGSGGASAARRSTSSSSPTPAPARTPASGALGRRLPDRLRLRMGDNFLDLDLRFKVGSGIASGGEPPRPGATELEAAEDEVALADDLAGRAFRHEFLVVPWFIAATLQRARPPRCCWPPSRTVWPPVPAQRLALRQDLLRRSSSMDRLASRGVPGVRPRSDRSSMYETVLHSLPRASPAPALSRAGPARETLGSGTGAAGGLAQAVHHRKQHVVPCRLEYATYQREHARYVDVELCERLFSVDSLAIAECLELLHAEADPEAVRWRLGALSMFSLLMLFDLEVAERDRLVESTIDGYSREFGVEANLSLPSSTGDTGSIARWWKPR